MISTGKIASVAGLLCSCSSFSLSLCISSRLLSSRSHSSFRSLSLLSSLFRSFSSRLLSFSSLFFSSAFSASLNSFSIQFDKRVVNSSASLLLSSLLSLALDSTTFRMVLVSVIDGESKILYFLSAKSGPNVHLMMISSAERELNMFDFSASSTRILLHSWTLSILCSKSF